MKKAIIRGVAAISVTSLLLTGCSETTNSSKEETKSKEQSSASKKKEQPTKVTPGVQFVYNGKEVTDADLEDYKKEVLSGLVKESYNELTVDSVARHYILVHELLKEFGSSEEELKKSYEEYKPTVDLELSSIPSLLEYTAKFISEKIVNRDLSSIEIQRKLYDGMDPIWKDDMSFIEFQKDKARIFKEALREETIDIGKIQQEAMKEADVKNANLHVDKKIKSGEYLPFSQFL